MSFQSRLSNHLWNILSSTIVPLLSGGFLNYSEYLSTYKKLIMENGLKIWEQAFTHKTFDPNSNYEKLAILGDSLQKTLFYDYMMKNYPQLDKGDLTIAAAYYLSEPNQVQIGQELQYNQYIRTIIPMNNSMIESVNDAVFGALFTIGNTFMENQGFELCQRYFNFIMNTQDIQDLIQKGADPKTQIKNRFEMMGWFGPGENVTTLKTTFQEDQEIRVRVSLTERALNYLRSQNIDVTDPKIGSGSGKIRSASEREAYQQAVSKLDELGITSKFVNMVKKSRIPNMTQALNKAQYEGLDDLETDILRSGEKVYVRLYGIRDLSNGMEEYQNLLITDTLGRKVHEVIPKMLEFYLTHGSHPGITQIL